MKSETEEIIIYVENLEILTNEELNRRINKDTWSVLECLKHLNLYGDFYLDEIHKKMNQNFEKSSEFFHSGFLGNYFAKSMLPKQKLNKMKTFKSMDPIHSNLTRDVIKEFLEQQSKMLDLLKIARSKDLEKTKTSISISKWIKLKLGDVFKIVIYHNIRHIQQIKNILNY
ncbi:DinB family protein [Sphingobacterium endophyticum]|uniref:DinB family protein n=1 Tax=Sphingobacterium endophyticum TaxID=2546448 RepID=UPI001E2C4D89|nr:DinB family protein [Sphingobacterium endophyticum]